LGAPVLPLGYCIVAEAGCNWYLSILIYSLYQKINGHTQNGFDHQLVFIGQADLNRIKHLLGLRS
jgi:hypothetical protein